MTIKGEEKEGGKIGSGKVKKGRKRRGRGRKKKEFVLLFVLHLCSEP